VTPGTAPTGSGPTSGLLCPACRAPLHAGLYVLSCQGCGRDFPIRSGVPRLLTQLAAGERQVQRAFNFEHARYGDSLRVHFRPELIDELCQDVRLPATWFAGKRCLDAGCGSGRWSYALASVGAEVVAVDLTDSGVAATRQALDRFPGAEVYQASLFELPFPHESFDFVMSWGVLHHTASTHAAFRRLVPLVKPGGTLYVMLYERTAPRYRLLTEVVRAALRALPDHLRYRACRLLVIRNPALYRVVSPWLKVCDASGARSEADVSTLVFDTFDAYSPRYNHVHTQTEVRRWFHEAGFTDVVLTRPVRFTTPDAVARWGECGGAVHVRGVRAPAGSALPSFDSTPVEASPLTMPTGHAAVDSTPTWGGDVPPFDQPVHDRWSGVRVSVPEGWTVSRDGAMTVAQPPLAIPPFQLGLYVRRATDSDLGELSAESLRRWLPADQEAALLDTTECEVDGAAGLRHTYRLTLGRAQARAVFLHFLHAGSLCRLSAMSAWGADEHALRSMDAAFGRFVSSVQLSAPRRDPLTQAARVTAMALAVRPTRLVRFAGRRLMARRPSVVGS
jgi:2-polyprenyl-3-methyl-5-hydroxy-6-metoxy-1,4-benzoquinol methylase